MWEKYGHIIGCIDTKAGAVERAGIYIRERFKNPLFVMDRHTEAAVEGKFDFCNFKRICFDDELLIANEFSIGRLLAAYEPDMDAFIAVGSGTIGDLCKFAACRVKRPVVKIGTAPSMDGYASSCSAMTFGKMKISPQTMVPTAVFCDPLILKEAPMNMIASGLGDIFGKITSLADWKLASLLYGERYDGEIASIVENAYDKCVKYAPMAKERSVEAIESITEALILSGIAMSLYGDSRPASGTEHHLAHYWEMRFLMEDKPPVLHGTKVGIATVSALRLWESLPEKPSVFQMPERALIVERIRKAYGESAEEILKTENPHVPFEKIEESWEEVLKIAHSLPEHMFIAKLLRGMGAPSEAEEIGVDAEMYRDSIELARERKKTYTLLQLLGNLGSLYTSFS